MTPLASSVVTVGTFDGIHRGHQEIIRNVVREAKAVHSVSGVVTFDPHPRQVLQSATAPPFEVLVDIDKKLELLEALRVNVTLVIPFSREFSQTSAAAFMREVLLERFHPRKIILGHDHHFGHGREGTAETMAAFAQHHGMEFEQVAPVRDSTEVISSTRIRELIGQGHVRRASFELGWIYGFQARVVHGAGRGRKLSFPTANFVPMNQAQLIPLRGVYFTRGLFAGKPHYGMCNLGYRPTFGEKEFVMEVHFFDPPQPEFYGEIIEVQFLERIRDERKFPSAEALITQMKQDREYCQSRLNIYKEE